MLVRNESRTRLTHDMVAYDHPRQLLYTFRIRREVRHHAARKPLNILMCRVLCRADRHCTCFDVGRTLFMRSHLLSPSDTKLV